jgi:hypothetical protein
MRINVRSEGFQLTPQLRGVVVSRLLSALRPFGAHIEVEREVSRRQAAPRAPHAAEAEPDALELVLDGNQISQQQREWLERPENYLRPIRIREYWRPSGVEDDEVPQELEPALAAPR